MTYQIHLGSNLDVLPTLPDNSVDSIVTDPPYELGFMGKSWDSSGIAYSTELWGECLRVLKPGGHLLAFGGSRTWHRLAVAIEDSGFQVRDSIAWLYGSGFPKSLDISKAIDKAAGAEREVLGPKRTPDGKTYAEFQKNLVAKSGGIMGKTVPINPLTQVETAPATPEAQQWEGWGTALKPAFEPVVVARKPLIGTVAENVLTYGTGGLNIDGSRIATTDSLGGGMVSMGRPKAAEGWDRPWMHDAEVTEKKKIESKNKVAKAENLGRWPSNVILDPYTAELLDEQTSHLKGATSRTTHVDRGPFSTGVGELVPDAVYGDTGGASRFFYVAKASKRDRNEGLEDIEGKEIGAKGNGLARTCAVCGASIMNPCECPDRTFVNPVRQNFHPTVKPTDLMRYLIKLVTPPGGVVLDPFTGSGSTGKAAILEGFDFIGIELTAEYLPIIEGRLAHAERLATEAKEKEDEALF